MSEYRVFARDVGYRRVGEIDDYAELKVQLRFNDIGGFVLTGSATSKVATLLSETGGIIITRDGHVVFSGVVATYSLDDSQVEVSGASDETLLIEHNALPDPSGPPYLTEQDLREGTASTVMLAYVNVNCGPGATAARRVTALTLATDLGIGSYVYGQAKWVSLLALLQDLALAGGGLRFQLLQSDATTGAIVFGVSTPQDRRQTVVISRGRGTLGSWKRSVSRPTATYVYALGQGQGVNRVVVEGGDAGLSTTYGRRIEAVLDRRDTDDVLALQQALSTTLDEGGEARVVSYTPVNTTSVAWGVDYDLGDLVTVITGDGEQLDEVVRGVDLTLTAPGGGSAVAEVQPIISTPGDTADDPASRQDRAVTRRVSNLERNVDSLSTILSVQWNIGDLRMTTRSAAAAGWLLCNGQAVSRITYSALFGIIGTTYGAGDGSTTFNVPDLQNRFPLGKSGAAPLGSTGGAASVDASHTHGPGTYNGPLHHHAAGTLAGPSHTHTGPSHTHTGPSHTHAAGTLAGPSHTHTGPSHTHAAGTLTVPNHAHAAGTLAGPSHTHAAGTYAGPSHTHAAGTLAGPSHTHGAAALGVGGTNTGQVLEVGSGGGLDLDTTVNLNHAGTDKVAKAAHTHGPGTLDVTGATDAGGTGSATGSTAADGTQAVTGSSAAGGTGTVTGSTATDGTATVTGSSAADGTQATGASGTGGATGSTAADGTGATGADGTGATGASGTGSVTGSTADDGAGAVTGSSATGGSAILFIVPPYLAVTYEIYAAA